MKARQVALLVVFIILMVILYYVAIKDEIPSESTDGIHNSFNAQGYSGSLSCRECHEDFYKLWSSSHHGLAMQPYTQEFSRKNLTAQTKALIIGDEEASYLAEIGPEQGWIQERISGRAKTYPVEHVVGGKNVYYFFTSLDRGRLQTLPLAYDVHKKQWFHTMASGVRHFPGSVTDEPLPWTDPMYTFNTSCYSCHVSQLATNYNLESDTYHTSWSEPGINCEACHGPGLEHVEVCRSASKERPPENMKIISTKAFSSRQMNSLCNSCHAKMSPISSSFTPGERFFDHFDLVMLESRDFYPDGRDLGENYTMTLWRMSPCVKNSDLNCMHCHTSSGRYRFKEPSVANNVCLPCHKNQVDNIAKHSFHERIEKSPQCISCHMPKTQFARMIRTDHSMRPPVPAATLKFKSPNACNLCHTDKNADWAQNQVSKWNKETGQSQYLLLAQYINQARQQDWQNLDRMLLYIQKTERDEIFAGSLIRLLRACDAIKKVPVFIKVLETDPSPLVRATAAEALTGHLTKNSLKALLRSTNDDYRLVRVRSAASLASANYKQLQVFFKDLQFAKHLKKNFEQAISELLEGLTARPDHYASHYNLGNLYMDLDKIDQALTSYQIAIRLRPDFVPSYVNIAFAFNAMGQNEKAKQSFQQALKMEPDNVLIQTNLALLLGELGQLPEAESAFRRVLQLDPNSATAAFNLAVILAEKNPQESLAFSKKAYSLSPEDPQYGYTYAFYLHRSRKTTVAIKVLKDMVNRQTTYADAYTMLGQIFEQDGKLKEAVEVYKKAAGNLNLSQTQRHHFSLRAEQARQRLR
jgi:tetratricopeptide (TPR) repeat protein